ncbi:MAG: hypothetical protein KGH71_00675 [Candidatus Micrarchaeota archaeon]|nr:hypothetical protein [Candidatus Micrarchaeota archaeon]
MIGTLLSIGAINALIPIIVILILIAAAAGSTRGSKLFEMFGIAALLGMSVGRGTLQKQSPFKSKKFKSDTNPFRKFGNAAIAAPKGKMQQTLNKAAVNQANNTSFNNLYGGKGLTHSGYALQQFDSVAKNLGPSGGTMTPVLSAAYKNAVNTHLAVSEGRFAHEKGRIMRDKTLTDSERQAQLDKLNDAHNKVMSKNLNTFNKEVEKIFSPSKNSAASAPGLGVRDKLRVQKYQALSNDAKAARVAQAELQNKINKKSILPMKTWLLQRSQEKERQKERDLIEELQKMKNDSKQRSSKELSKIFGSIDLERLQTAREDYNKTIAKSKLNKIMENISNYKKYHNENK